MLCTNESKAMFEVHNLESKELPLIFHKDTCKSTGFDCGNWHTNIELLLVTGGEGSCSVGAETLEMYPEDLIVVNSNLLHRIVSSTEVQYHCLIIDSDFCLQNNLPTERLRYRSLIRSDEANRLYRNVVSELENTLPYRSAGVKAALLNLLVFLTRNYLETDPVKIAEDSSTDENIKLAIGYIKSHFHERLSLEDVAREAGLSKYYFLREFKKATSLTPVAYINCLRCENAKKLLLSGKYTVHEIAIKCGYENDSYFSKSFKRYTGLLPSAYAGSYTDSQYSVIPEQCL